MEQKAHFTLNLTLFNRLPLHPAVDAIVGDFTSLTLLEIDRTPPTPSSPLRGAVQQQLWRDLDQRYFSGVRVLRELARRQERTGQALMPVVFTSALGLGSDGDSERFPSCATTWCMRSARRRRCGSTIR